MSQIIDAILYARDLPWTRGFTDFFQYAWGEGYIKGGPVCVRGQEAQAIHAVDLSDLDRERFNHLLEEVVGTKRISLWNDDPSRTQSDIDNMWDEVLRLAKERNL